MFSHMPVEKRLHSLDLLNMGGGGGGEASAADKVLIGETHAGGHRHYERTQLACQISLFHAKIEKYLKKFCHAQQRWEGQFLDFVGGHITHGGSPN